MRISGSLLSPAFSMDVVSIFCKQKPNFRNVNIQLTRVNSLKTRVRSSYWIRQIKLITFPCDVLNSFLNGKVKILACFINCNILHKFSTS